MPLDHYLDAVYVILISTTSDELQRSKELEDQLEVAAVRIAHSVNPEAAYQMWGASDHAQAQAARLE